MNIPWKATSGYDTYQEAYLELGEFALRLMVAGAPNYTPNIFFINLSKRNIGGTYIPVLEEKYYLSDYISGELNKDSMLEKASLLFCDWLAKWFEFFVRVPEEWSGYSFPRYYNPNGLFSKKAAITDHEAEVWNAS